MVREQDKERGGREEVAEIYFFSIGLKVYVRFSTIYIL